VEDLLVRGNNSNLLEKIKVRDGGSILVKNEMSLLLNITNLK